MDRPTAAVAAAAALGTAGVAIYGLRHQAEQAEKDRAHDAEMRRQERRAQAHVELLTALDHQQMQVDRSAPIFVEASPPDAPPSLTDEELWRLNALSAVIASDELGRQIEEWTKTYGVMALEQRQKVEVARSELQADIRATGDQVRGELHAVASTTSAPGERSTRAAAA